MPLLEFRCEECGLKFEELVRASDADKLRCPNCGADKLRQVFMGKCLAGPVGTSSGCSGSCSGCRGCHH